MSDVKLTRLDLLDKIINTHIESLQLVDEPKLIDTKQLTEILKSILTMNQIRKLEIPKSEFETVSTEDLISKLESNLDDMD